MSDAVILLNKESGITSFACLGKVKKVIDRKTGHCGTLDRFAEGLIIALCGKYTKLNPSFIGLDKRYEAEIKFGEETNTLDPEGEVVAVSALPERTVLEKAIETLKGKIMQKPPVYSAIHVNGQRSYKMARSGKDFELEARPVEIYGAELVSYENGIAKVKLHVSKGTYVRSWARDLGLACNSRAYVKALKRTAIGPFSLNEAVSASSVEELVAFDVSKSAEFLKRLENYENPSVL